MLHKSLSYKVLFRVAGVLFLALGLYRAVNIAFSPAESGNNLSRILLDILGPYGGEFPYGAAFVYVGLGILFLGLGSMRVRIAYWSLQIAVWLIGISFWYEQQSRTAVQLVPPLATPTTFWPQMAITLICSLLLFALYIPLTHLLRKLYAVWDKNEKFKELITTDE